VDITDGVPCFCSGSNENCHYCAGTGVRHPDAGAAEKRWCVPREAEQPRPLARLVVGPFRKAKGPAVGSSRKAKPPSFRRDPRSVRPAVRGEQTEVPAARAPTVHCRHCNTRVYAPGYVEHFRLAHAWETLLAAYHATSAATACCPLCMKTVQRSKRAWTKHAANRHRVSGTWSEQGPRGHSSTRLDLPRVSKERPSMPASLLPWAALILIRCSTCRDYLVAEALPQHAGHEVPFILAPLSASCVCKLCQRVIAATAVPKHFQSECSKRRKAKGLLNAAKPRLARNTHAAPSDGSGGGLPQSRPNAEGEDPRAATVDERRLDATRDYGHAFRESGQFGSHPAHDDHGEESEP